MRSRALGLTLPWRRGSTHARGLRTTRKMGDGKEDDHFAIQAQEYAAFRPRYPAPLVDLALSFAPVSQTAAGGGGGAAAATTAGRSLALDIGCGSGQMCTLLAPHFAKVVGVDRSAAQLDHGMQFVRHGAGEGSGNITYLQGDATALLAPELRAEVPDGGVDLATACQMAHWLTGTPGDMGRFSEGVVKKLKPETGRLVIAGYGLCRPLGNEALEHHFMRFYERLNNNGHWPALCDREALENGMAGINFHPLRVLQREWFPTETTMSAEAFFAYLGTWSAVAPRPNLLVELEGQVGMAPHDPVRIETRFFAVVLEPS